jgi:hypothetical protein
MRSKVSSNRVIGSLLFKTYWLNQGQLHETTPSARLAGSSKQWSSSSETSKPWKAGHAGAAGPPTPAASPLIRGKKNPRISNPGMPFSIPVAKLLVLEEHDTVLSLGRVF